MIDLDSYLVEPDMLLEKSRLGFNVDDLKSKIKDKKISGSAIKQKINLLLAHSPESLASDVPTIMDIISYTIIIGVPTIISPLLTIPVAIATKVVRDSADAKVIGGYISKYALQIKNVERKMNTEKDPKKKAFWKDYKEQLESGLDKLKDKKESLRGLDPEGKLETRFDEAVDILLVEYNMLTYEQKELLLSEGMLTNVKRKAKEVKKAVTDKEKAMDKWFNDTLTDIRQKSRDKSRDALVEDRFPQLSKMIKRAIWIGAAWCISPAIAAVEIVVQFAISKRAKDKERKRILSELKNELDVVEEKIKDADSASDRKKKYELMRLRHKLQYEIDRLRRYI